MLLVGMWEKTSAAARKQSRLHDLSRKTHYNAAARKANQNRKFEANLEKKEN